MDAASDVRTEKDICFCSKLELYLWCCSCFWWCADRILNIKPTYEEGWTAIHAAIFIPSHCFSLEMFWLEKLSEHQDHMDPRTDRYTTFHDFPHVCLGTKVVFSWNAHVCTKPCLEVSIWWLPTREKRFSQACWSECTHPNMASCLHTGISNQFTFSSLTRKPCTETCSKKALALSLLLLSRIHRVWPVSHTSIFLFRSFSAMPTRTRTWAPCLRHFRQQRCRNTFEVDANVGLCWKQLYLRHPHIHDKIY